MTTEERKTYPYRSEILFLYDVFRCNPNGDPFENRPRQDPTTGRIDVTDVRLKRTIRDYILDYKHQPGKDDNLDIFVQVAGERPLTAENRYKEMFGELPKRDQIGEARKKLITQCVDVRSFGALIPITEKGEEKGAGIQITGAVQFNPGQSLHEVEVMEIAGTGGFASREAAGQKTFRREFIVPYALIGFYGVINENLAKESGLSEDDVKLLMEAIWEGTLALHSRSKAFHHPRLLVRLDYTGQRQCGYFLDKLVLKNRVNKEKEIRSPKDYTLDIAPWLAEVKKVKDEKDKDGKTGDHIKGVYCRLDSGLPLVKDENTVNLEEELKMLTTGVLEFVQR